MEDKSVNCKECQKQVDAVSDNYWEAGSSVCEYNYWCPSCWKKVEKDWRLKSWNGNPVYLSLEGKDPKDGALVVEHYLNKPHYEEYHEKSPAETYWVYSYKKNKWLIWKVGIFGDDRIKKDDLGFPPTPESKQTWIWRNLSTITWTLGIVVIILGVIALGVVWTERKKKKCVCGKLIIKCRRH